MFKRGAAALAAFALALASLGVAVVPAFAKSEVVTKEGTITAGKLEYFWLGRSGFYSPKAGLSGDLDATRMSIDQFKRPSWLIIDQSPVKIEVDSANETADRSIAFLRGVDYVYFDLSHSEQSAWKAGTLAIYQYNDTNKTWKKLPTFSVAMSATSFGRVAARIAGSGIYALGTVKQ